ncbi:putative secreted glycosidase like protein [Verticillium longisporum]|nr:putative secreted glycosidase like protein [Verticillium longisporum]
MATLADLMGGRAALAARLEYYHASGLAYLGNEQAFLTVFQFHHAARPGLSAKWARAYVPAQFNGTMAGIPGNDDGAMGAFAAFVMMGFFPVAGMDVYLLTAPFFREVRLRARKPGREAVIRKVAARGEDPMAEGMIYVQSIKLNGRKWTKSWITHDFFAEGGLLEVKVGREESAWGTKEEDLPPSWGFEEFKGGEGQAPDAEPSHSVGEHIG